MKCNLDNEIKKAKWITAPSEIAAPVISRHFVSDNPTECKIAISALGFFEFYINGKRVGNEYFLPSNSIFRKRSFTKLLYPISDEFTYRCYYSIFDISDYVQEGDNLIEIALGDGWYRQTERTAEGNMQFGDELGTIFCVCISDSDGERIIHSDGTEQCRNSGILYSQLFYGEIYDARIDRDKKYTYSNVSITELPETILTPEDAPHDREIRKITPKPIYTANSDTVIYDAGENISGFAVITAAPADGEKIQIRYSENIKDNVLDFGTTGYDTRLPFKAQLMEDTFIGDGNLHKFAPKFVWHAFRYFEIEGKVEDVSVSVIHSDVAVTSEFECSAAELNWLYDAYLRTQLDNMHGGVPSDCPHRERLGYTGDGQVCAPAAMLLLDTKAFYRKWIRDIFDSQDKITGHSNHTAPFAGGGGGPCGWGGAAITVPYNYYKHFGDKKPLEEYYSSMKKWIDYLESRSENGLITREEEGGWCLGDWQTLEKTVIPEPLVNTCLFINSLQCMKEIAEILGETQDIERYDTLCNSAKEGVYAQYYDEETSSFAQGVQGADAYAIYAGLGDEKTLANLISKYEKADKFDTGFICTSILTDILFDNGKEDIAFKLITSHKPGGFGYMLDNGATTIYETWWGYGSHNHPMFGGCTKNLISSILGITQKDDSVGYKNVVIAPHIPNDMTYAKGCATLPCGKVGIKWQKNGDGIEFEITLPDNFTCDFKYKEKTLRLNDRVNSFTLNPSDL